MKKHLEPLFLLIFVILLVLSATFAEANVKNLAPYALTATEITPDELHPYGSAKLTFKINSLPGETGDNTLTWYVNIEKQIGNGEWIHTNAIPSVTMLSDHKTGVDTYSFEQLWIEDYVWDGSKKISYRVWVSLDDLVGQRGGQSAYSNVASLGLVSSTWAVPELKEASNLGLIPAILQGADLTKPITREEFCELAVLLYEKVTGTNAQASPNPFTDTANQQILKAFNLGITKGISATTFEPKTLINREQCAAMLFRAIQAINPSGNYDTASLKSFPDQGRISSWATDAAKYMASLGIIKGDVNGNFMPKATTTAQIAAAYGMATREAAILMSVRTYNQLK